MNRLSAIVVASLTMIPSMGAAAEEADLVMIANVQHALEATGKERARMTAYLESIPVQSPAVIAASLSLILNRPARWVGPADMRYPVLDMINRSITADREAIANSPHRDAIANYLGALLVRGRDSERFYYLMKIKTAGRLWTLEDVPLVLDLVGDGRARAMGVELYRLVTLMNEAQKAKLRRILFRDPDLHTREDEMSVLILANMARPSEFLNVIRNHAERYQALGREIHRRYYPATGLIMPSEFLSATNEDEMRAVVRNIGGEFPMAQQIRLAELTLEKIHALYLQGNASVIEAINTAHENALKAGLDSWNVAEFFRRLKGEGFNSAGGLALSGRGQVLEVDFNQRRVKSCDDGLESPEE